MSQPMILGMEKSASVPIEEMSVEEIRSQIEAIDQWESDARDGKPDSAKKDAVKKIENVAKQVDSAFRIQAMFSLSKIYFKGWGVTEDLKKAYEWWIAAANIADEIKRTYNGEHKDALTIGWGIIDSLSTLDYSIKIGNFEYICSLIGGLVKVNGIWHSNNDLPRGQKTRALAYRKLAEYHHTFYQNTGIEIDFQRANTYYVLAKYKDYESKLEELRQLKAIFEQDDSPGRRRSSEGKGYYKDLTEYLNNQ